jgi:nucleotide-binding universal stress UspA family protein
MSRLDRILIPTDFSELATHALTYARDFALSCLSELHVLHVVPLAVELSAATGGFPMGTSAVLMESLQDVVGRRSDELRSYVQGIQADSPMTTVFAVRTGTPWEEIVNYSMEMAVDLIVMGTHGRGMIKRMLRGSTSKAVLEHSTCPVLMVPLATFSGEAHVDASRVTSGSGAGKHRGTLG